MQGAPKRPARETTSATQATNTPPSEKAKGPPLDSGFVAEMVKSPEYHEDPNRAGAVAVLAGKPESSWRLRDGRDGELTNSQGKEGQLARRLIATARV